MKFFCEYCGCRIDADVDKKCPNCGASYKKNATFIKLQEEEKERADKVNEFKDEVFKHTTSVFKFSRIFFFLPVVVFIIIIATAIIINIRMNHNTSGKPVTVSGLKASGETSQYSAKVTSYEDVTFWHKEAKEGYKFVKFYIEVENLSGKQINREDVNCVVDGVAQTNEFSSGYSTIPFFISKGLTVKGEATFEVPKDAKSYDIKYGDDITIHIDIEK